MSEVLCLKKITHHYGPENNRVHVLNALDFTLSQGKICALLGPSGSGKSTILQIAGLLDTPVSGEVMISGENCNKMQDDQKSFFRGQKIGFIYQFHRLLPELTAIENVMMPQLLSDQSPDKARIKASELLDGLGLKQRENHLPTELSGGEQQRVAIARALINQPDLILADEPTGNLDPATSVKVFEQLTEFVRSKGAAALIATHNMALAEKADFIFSPFN